MKYFDEDNEEVRECIQMCKCFFLLLLNIYFNIMLIYWLILSSLTHFDLIHSLFQICINSQGEKNT